MSNKSLAFVGALTVLRTGSAIARDTREIATAWSRYYQDLVRHTSEAGQTLSHATNINEMLEAQAKLMRGATQLLHDTMVALAETASRMTTRPHDALQDASSAD